MKRKEHKKEIEITDFELNRIFEVSPVKLGLFLENIFCPNCKNPELKKLVDYKIYIDELNDTILKGKCAGCSELAIRYIETGENTEMNSIIAKIRVNRKC
ncbi:MAG: hypothetical protein JKY09_07415 [Crocinitomicaceae bacterium]|nr:hypothetical protein [Crocinitomicaceae bacterium]